MSLIRVAGIAVLIMALTPGCALYQSLVDRMNKPAAPSQPLPIETQSALEPKLDEMSGRLGRMEQAINEVREQGRRRQQSEQQARQSLNELRQGMQTTYAAVTDVQKQMRQVSAQQAALRVRLEQTAGIAGRVEFWAVDVPLGGLPNTKGQPEVRRIPALVPDKAREILVYAQIATGFVKGGAHRFRIAVQVEGERQAAFFLYAFAQPQPSWSYNSDNVWLPMPKNRELILQVEGEPFFGDWGSEVRIIAWR